MRTAALYDWLLLGPDVRPQRTVYDLQNAARRIRQTNDRQAEALAAANVLAAPTEEAMLAVFSKSER